MREGGLSATLTAHLTRRFGEGMRRQPLLSPAMLAPGATGNPGLPVLPARPGERSVLVAGVDIREGARVFVDGRRTPGSVECLFGAFTPNFCSSQLVRIALPSPPTEPGLHLLQVQNPEGPLSNEMPICVGTPLGCR